MEPGRYVRQLRQAARLRLDEVAARLGCSTAYISLLETSERPLTVDWFTRLLTAIDELHTESEQRYQDVVVGKGTEPEPEPDDAQPEPEPAGVSES
ncbi:MAG: helix-turn-helix domain-containing protein [Veillonellaceae bacterium]|nr:helix-turn-helix domain-containing protein [Veillonellaceae bacterium]